MLVLQLDGAEYDDLLYAVLLLQFALRNVDAVLSAVLMLLPA